MLKKILLAAGIALLSGTAANAECSFENDVPLRSLSAAFDAWRAVTGTMAQCGNFQAELDQEFIQKQAPAFAANPSLYHIGGVANATLVPLVNQGTIRPLDDLIEKYGGHLTSNQFIRIGGETMAVAMMVNTQHLMYRSDIFEELGLEAPETYDEMLAAAEAIREADLVDYPIGATMRAGWDLAQDFVNMFMGYGGRFVDDGNQPTVNGEAGIQALEMMEALTEYMDPEYLSADSTYVQQQFQQGRIAMANLWATRAAAMDDEAESEVVGQVAMAAAPAVEAGSPPATTIWWDGIVIARNITDEEADAAFRLAMEGLSTRMVEANNDAAVWLIAGYEPGPLAEGAAASAEAGAPSYPSSAAMGLMQTALGENLPNFFTGSRSAEETLADVEAAYLASARESGLIE